jgi:SSS family solute:Na+ symporter
LVFAALYWKRLTAWGAYASILAMAAAWLYLFRESGYGANSRFTVSLSLNGSTYEIMPVVVIFGCSMLALVVVSLITPAPSEKTLKRHFG